MPQQVVTKQTEMPGYSADNQLIPQEFPDSSIQGRLTEVRE